MNLDLNLGSFVNPPQDDQPHSFIFEDLLHGSMREDGSNPPIVSHRLPPPVWIRIPTPTDAGGAAASVAADNNVRPPKLLKTDGDDDDDDDDGSFFDCNICLDLANEPVVTCCGHLFCWPCIYRWLFVHSNAKQCPICKGEVTMKTITPIYSRAKRTNVAKLPDPNLSFKVPSRPLANRIESWRQSFQRNAINFPVIDMVRRLDNNRSHFSRDPQEISSTHLLNRIFTSRGIRRGQDSVPTTSPDVTVDLPNDDIPDLTSAESFIDSYLRDYPEERNQAELPLIDRHSMASVADIIQPEIMTTGTGSTRRRGPSAFRVLDVDSGNSHARRRRLH